MPEREREYDRVISELFKRIYVPRTKELEFTKDELAKVCRDLGITIRNIPDILYTYRSRSALPKTITRKGNWIIEGKGRGKYAFIRLKRSPYIEVPLDLEAIPIPDSTPEIILKYSGPDEQSLLARIRYNRLVDIFLSLTAYQLQGHFRTSLKDTGQVEIDELYLGVDTEGTWYVIPIEAKGPDPRDQIGLAQVRWLIAFAEQRYSELTVRPVAAKAWEDGSIFLIEFNPSSNLEEIRTVRYKRYILIHEEGKNEP